MNLRAFKGAANSFNVFISASVDQSRVFTNANASFKLDARRLSLPNPELRALIQFSRPQLSNSAIAACESPTIPLPTVLRNRSYRAFATATA